MKFWLTVVFGVLVIAAGSTTMLVINPNIQPKLPPEVVEDYTDHATATPVGETKLVYKDVAQHQQGHSIFRIRNDGKSKLDLVARRPTCTCTDLFLSDREYSLSETTPPKESAASMTLAPGEIAVVNARWDTKEKLGPNHVDLPIGTSDRTHKEIVFKIELTIHQEVVASSSVVDFGQLDEREKSVRFVDMTSGVRDSVEIKDLNVSSPFLKVRAEPTPKAELAKIHAKSGSRIIVELDGKQPVGSMAETVYFKAKTPVNEEPRQLSITGRVVGDIEYEPSDPRIDLKEVTRSSNTPRQIRIFARKLKAGDSLQLGAVKPAFLAAKIEKHPRFNLWTLTVGVGPTAPPGPINDGRISVVDSNKVEKLVFRVVGVVDSDFGQVAAQSGQ